MEYFPDNVLDVGCGLGALVNLLRKYGVEAYGIDDAKVLPEKFWKEPYFSIADAKNLPYKDREFDVVFSSDFFEHIREQDVNKVADEMRRVGKIRIAEIAFETPLTARQSKYHVTNKPRDWWEEKLFGFEIL